MRKEDWKFLPTGTLIRNNASDSYGMVVSMGENPTKKTIRWEIGSLGEELTDKSSCVTQFCEVIYKPNNNKINNMKITNLVKKILDKDTRILVEAGFINGDLALTDDGAEELLGLLFIEKKDELVKIAKEKIADSK